MRKRTYIIAEAGVNHNGSLETARRMIDAAVRAGADAIKFQTFKAEKLATRYAGKAKYQISSGSGKGSQLDMLRELELDIAAHRELMGLCRKKGIEFLSSPFDQESADILHGLGLGVFKIPSGEITNLPYLRKIGSCAKEVILSTGMSMLREIRDALCVLDVMGVPKSRITVLQCNTEYPTPVEDANLLGMLTIREKFGVKVGYSDHTIEIETAVAAAALGASVIEKHFTLSRSMRGPDHKSSLEPRELAEMVKAIRNVEKALGHGKKKVSPSEEKNKGIVRKSIVAAEDIKKGEVFTENNLTTKRPGTGLSPMRWDRVLGTRARKDFKKDELIDI